MSWTKEAPTEDGWYWWRFSDDYPGEVLEILADQSVWYCGEWKYATEFGGEWWPEPIKEPPK